MARGDGSSNNELFKRNYLHLAPPVSRSPPSAYQKISFYRLDNKNEHIPEEK